jgi:hypothetical protein
MAYSHTITNPLYMHKKHKVHFRNEVEVETAQHADTRRRLHTYHTTQNNPILPTGTKVVYSVLAQIPMTDAFRQDMNAAYGAHVTSEDVQQIETNDHYYAYVPGVDSKPIECQGCGHAVGDMWMQVGRSRTARKFHVSCGRYLLAMARYAPAPPAAAAAALPVPAAAPAAAVVVADEETDEEDA